MNIPVEFPLFPSLPSELRLKIWKHCLPDARVVPIRLSRVSKQYITNQPPSPLLHTTSESRSLFLSFYTNLTLSLSFTSAIYVDFSIDTILFDTLECSPGGDLALDLASSLHRDAIQRVAIGVELWEVLRVFRWDALSEVKCLGGLRTISLVLMREQRLGLEAGLAVAGPDGREHIVVRQVEGETNVETEIRHSLWHVECLRAEVGRSVREEGNWGGVSGPNVQLWLW